MKNTRVRKLIYRLLFVIVTGASISLSQAEDENALHKECFKEHKGRSCVRLGTALWQSPSARLQARQAFAKGCELKIESACTLKEMPINEGAVAIGSAKPEAAGPIVPGIEMTGPAQFKVSRSAARRFAGDLEYTLQSAKLNPEKTNGKISGYRFTEIKKHSVFEALGFRRNDVVLKINDQEIHSPSEAAQLLPQLLYGPTDRYAVKISRAGQDLVQNFEIVD